MNVCFEMSLQHSCNIMFRGMTSKPFHSKCAKFPTVVTSVGKFFYILLTVHLNIILVINLLDAKKTCFIISLLNVSKWFEHYVLIIRRSKLYYIASGIITPVGGRLVHRLRKEVFSQPVHRTTTYRCYDNRCCIIQFLPPGD